MGLSTYGNHLESLQGHLLTLEEFNIPTRVDFDIIAREGSFNDSTIAGYQIFGEQSHFFRTAHQAVDKWVHTKANTPLGMFGVRFDGVQPKSLSFDIMYRADTPDPGTPLRGGGKAPDIPGSLTPSKIIKNIQVLQSFCYPRIALAGNPPLALLIIRSLYSVTCYVKSIQVSWTNYWDIHAGEALNYELNSNPNVAATRGIQRGLGLPMGADISVEVMLAEYPTAEYVISGGTFQSVLDVGAEAKVYKGEIDLGMTDIAN